MKRLLTIVLLAMSFGAVFETASAQRIAYGERTPRINHRHSLWIDGRQPEQSDDIFIAFIYSRSNTCIELCYGLAERLKQSKHPWQVILITREPVSSIDPRIRECLGGNITAICDESGTIFRDFGVRYVPFAILVKDKRAIWFGNPLTSERDIFRDESLYKNRRTKRSKSR